MKQRNLRVASLIREELGKLMMREIEFPGMIVTITEAEVGSKLDRAKVGVSVYPSEKALDAFKILEKSRGSLEHLLRRKLNIKPMPRVEFFIDRGPEHAARIEKELLELEE